MALAAEQRPLAGPGAVRFGCIWLDTGALEQAAVAKQDGMTVDRTADAVPWNGLDLSDLGKLQGAVRGCPDNGFTQGVL